MKRRPAVLFGLLCAELSIAAVVGVAACSSSGTPSADPTQFRVSRFSDGSPITLGPEI